MKTEDSLYPVAASADSAHRECPVPGSTAALVRTGLRAASGVKVVNWRAADDRQGLDEALRDRLENGIADPFNGHIDEFRIAHIQRSDGWIETTWNNMSAPGAFAAAGAEDKKAASRHPLPAPVSSSA
jgi:hypothetical protein